GAPFEEVEAAARRHKLQTVWAFRGWAEERRLELAAGATACPTPTPGRDVKRPACPSVRTAARTATLRPRGPARPRSGPPCRASALRRRRARGRSRSTARSR